MRARTAIATCIFLVAATGLGALGVAYSGLVDVSATAAEPALLRWFLETTRQRSVARRVAATEVPDLGDPERLRVGLAHYQAMCVGCHGAPGVDRDEVGAGLHPRPPHLADTEAGRGDPARTFWVIRNGIRMTGMPAFGPTHDDDTLWSIVALVNALPGMQPGEYGDRLADLPPRTSRAPSQEAPPALGHAHHAHHH